VNLEPVELACLGLVTMASLGVDSRDHPVLGNLLGDAKDPVVALFGVLSRHEDNKIGGVS
jgi:hypothetical protein